jgi:hypothetical protein
MHYAAQKWSKRLAVEKGHIMFQPEREVVRNAPELIRKKRAFTIASANM